MLAEMISARLRRGVRCVLRHFAADLAGTGHRASGRRLSALRRAKTKLCLHGALLAGGWAGSRFRRSGSLMFLGVVAALGTGPTSMTRMPEFNIETKQNPSSQKARKHVCIYMYMCM